jgi:hypothetical protein
MEKSDVTVVIGVVVPAGVFLIVFIIVCLVRRSRATPSGYSQVAHTLDDEEIEFKRMIEMQSDDIEELFSGGDHHEHDDVEFDHKEIDRLNMLEQYRDRLVAGAEAASSESLQGLHSLESGQNEKDSDINENIRA